MASCSVCLHGERGSLPAVCTPHIASSGFLSHTSGISSDYDSFFEAVKAAKANQDEHAFQLLEKSEEAIEEVVSICDGCSTLFLHLLALQAQTWGMTFVVVCGTTSFHPPTSSLLMVETRSCRGCRGQIKSVR